MSISPTPNPLKHVLNAIGEDVEWLTYGTYMVQARAYPANTCLALSVCTSSEAELAKYRSIELTSRARSRQHRSTNAWRIRPNARCGMTRSRTVIPLPSRCYDLTSSAWRV